ncbi:putative ribonuclease H-like domain-containing protein, partial [Tanacetum coccineum]
SSSNLQNVAFVSENTSSTNEVSTAHGVSNTSGHYSKHEQTSSCFVCGSFSHLIRDCDYHAKLAKQVKLNKQNMSKGNGKGERKPTWNNVQRVNKQNQFVPLAVQTRTGNNPVNTVKASGTNYVSTARRKINKQTVLTSTALKVNTVKPIMNDVRPSNVFHKTHSPSSRPFKRTTVLKTNFSKQKVYTVKVKEVSTVGEKWDTADNPHRSLKNKGIIDSGCSRHMTGNKAYLADFQDFNGGPVAFGGSKGYITGKGKIKTGKLDFEDVSFVKELQPFNLFSVSQMCDKKNKVLFTDTEWKGPNWLFDLDYLTDSMNYQSVRSENQANLHAGQKESNQNTGTKDKIDAGDSEKEDESNQDCFELPIWHSYSSTNPFVSKSDNKIGSPRDEEQVFLDDLARLQRQEKEANEEAEALRENLQQETEHLVTQAEAAKSSGTNIFSTVSTTAKASGTNFVNTVSIPVSTASANEGLSLSNTTNTQEDDSEIPPLEDIHGDTTDGIFTHSSYDDEGAFCLCSGELHKFLDKLRFSEVLKRKLAGGCVAKKNCCSLGDFQKRRGVVVRNKARLVAQGHRQEEGIDYDEFEASMKSRFQMSSMGELTFFLGLQVKQKPNGIFISQDKYVAKILKKFDFASVKTASTPIETQKPLVKDEEANASTPLRLKPLVKDEEASDVDVHLYRSMIGSLMYVTASRPDIMFAVCACSRFQVTPKTSHLSAVKRIFRYLKGKPKLGLWYPRESSFDLESYSDSDYAGANLDRKSTTGGCQFLGRRLITWQCKKQTIVATSTTEAEYVAAVSCCGQVLWIQNQMLDYGFNFMNTKNYIDYESTICIVKNPAYHSKTKHIAIRHHFIRDAYEKKLIQVLKIHIDDNVADLLTKAFDVSRFQFLVSKKIAQVVSAWIKSKNSLVKHFEDMRLCRPSKEYLQVKLVSMVDDERRSRKMAALESCPKHNMIAYLEKTEGNVEFHEVIDFLRRSYIYHALTDKC